MVPRADVPGVPPHRTVGQERDPFEMAAFFEEAALAGAPLDGLHLTMMVAGTLRHVGTAEQQRSILPGVLAGETLIALELADGVIFTAVPSAILKRLTPAGQKTEESREGSGRASA